jgi:hypothetical protein
VVPTGRLRNGLEKLTDRSLSVKDIVFWRTTPSGVMQRQRPHLTTVELVRSVGDQL